ncbi:isochorismatase family protein [Marinobacter sp.]|uniref:isochorismatase family protein n=1 Tax=Marinobacter sp. TaxID=50741 RepID=UPI0019E70EDA|nr:isochorismatase family protein [Marinobacter sp.]MBE0485013.1 isochorismatase family protein [Marinobacter sp.]
MPLQSRSITRAEKYALVVVDMSIGFTDPSRSPLASEANSVIEANQHLLAIFREQGLPVFFTTVAYSSPDQARIFREKLPELNVLEAGSGLEDIDPRVAPEEGEPVIVKHWPSGFFKTDLDERLREAGVDGVVVTGLTTSGCVRATALGCLQHEYRTIVPREAVGDRDLDAHEANLKDLELKYVDVLSLEETIRKLK